MMIILLLVAVCCAYKIGYWKGEHVTNESWRRFNAIKHKIVLGGTPDQWNQKA